MKRFFYIIAAASVMLVSCNKEETLPVEKEGIYPVLFSGSSVLAKTSMGDIAGSRMQMLWSLSDRIGLYISTGTDASQNTQNMPVVLTDGDKSGAGCHTGNFATTLALSEGKTYDIVIYYPWSGQAGTDASSISHSVPSVQYQGASGDNYGFNGGFAYATSRIDTPAIIQDGYAPEVPFTLSYQTSYAWLSVKPEDSSLDGWKVRKVIVKASEGTPLAGSFSFSLTENAEEELEPTLTLGEDTSDEVVLNVGGDIALSTESYRDFRLTVLPSKMAGKTLTITYCLESADGSAVRTITHTRAISASSTSFLAGNAHRFVEDIPTGSTGEWTISADTFDLSAGGTANSYIVSSSGNYSFDATVIGNGEDGIMLPVTTTKFHTENAGISPVSASLLWQTTAGLITDVVFADGRISFKKPDGKDGNALVAAKDADGNIVWSWHIWCTDMGEAQVYSGTYGTYCMMDRNLGATYASTGNPGTNELWDKTMGLYYQWGRKDPFVGPYGIRNKGNAADNEELNGGVAAFAEIYDADGTIFTRPAVVKCTPDIGTIENAIANPTLFIAQADAGSDWFYGGGNKKTGPENRGYHFWGNPEGYNYKDAAPPAPKKTIYDPCPPGWMVPSGAAYSAIAIKTNVSYRGYVATYDGVNTTWIPRPGNLLNSTGMPNNYIGTVAYYWTSHFKNNSACVVAALYMSGSTSNVSNYYNSAGGFPLRCMKEL